MKSFSAELFRVSIDGVFIGLSYIINMVNIHEKLNCVLRYGTRRWEQGSTGINTFIYVIVYKCSQYESLSL